MKRLNETKDERIARMKEIIRELRAIIDQQSKALAQANKDFRTQEEQWKDRVSDMHETLCLRYANFNPHDPYYRHGFWFRVRNLFTKVK
jgi:hypothetical protein